MTAHRINYDLHNGKNLITDPGASGTITVDRSLAVCNLTSAGAETRTLARPTKAGVIVSIHLQSRVGDVTLTVTGGYDTGANTTIVFGAESQYAVFESFQLKSAGNYFWRLVKLEGGAVLQGYNGTYQYSQGQGVAAYGPWVNGQPPSRVDPNFN